jgi:hypothetical protein
MLTAKITKKEIHQALREYVRKKYGDMYDVTDSSIEIEHNSYESRITGGEVVLVPKKPNQFRSKDQCHCL